MTTGRFLTPDPAPFCASKADLSAPKPFQRDRIFALPYNHQSHHHLGTEMILLWPPSTHASHVRPYTGPRLPSSMAGASIRMNHPCAPFASGFPLAWLKSLLSLFSSSLFGLWLPGGWRLESESGVPAHFLSKTPSRPTDPSSCASSLRPSHSNPAGTPASPSWACDTARMKHGASYPGRETLATAAAPSPATLSTPL